MNWDAMLDEDFKLTNKDDAPYEVTLTCKGTDDRGLKTIELEVYAKDLYVSVFDTKIKTSQQIFDNLRKGMDLFKEIRNKCESNDRGIYPWVKNTIDDLPFDLTATINFPVEYSSGVQMCQLVFSGLGGYYTVRTDDITCSEELVEGKGVKDLLVTILDKTVENNEKQSDYFNAAMNGFKL